MSQLFFDALTKSIEPPKDSFLDRYEANKALNDAAENLAYSFPGPEVDGWDADNCDKELRASVTALQEAVETYDRPKIIEAGRKVCAFLVSNESYWFYIGPFNRKAVVKLQTALLKF